jgi:DNA-binding MarR family transcriptional regulator
MKAWRDSLGFLTADVSRLTRRAFARHLEDCSVTLNEARALVNVARNEGVRQVDLAELLEIQPIQLARLIDRLAELKLVERRPAPDDRRAYNIHLLPGAAQVLSSFEAVGNKIWAEALRGLTAQQVAAIHDGLRHIHNNLTSHRDEPEH